jgi:hypothetical protein
MGGRRRSDTGRQREIALDVREPGLLSRRLQRGGTDATAFSRVAESAAMGDRRSVALERMESRITIHDFTGAVLSSVGRKGNGPGGFRSAWALGSGAGTFVGPGGLPEENLHHHLD